MSEDIDDFAFMLRTFAQAYPEDIFGPVTAAEREWLHRDHPGLQDRIAGAMGRHLAKHFDQAADKIEAMAAEAKLFQREIEGLRDALAKAEGARGQLWNETAAGRQHRGNQP